MSGLLTEAALQDFLIVFLPAMAFFALLNAYRWLMRLWWAALAFGATALLASYQPSGYPRILADIAHDLSDVPLACATGFISAVFIARPLLRLWRMIRAHRAPLPAYAGVSLPRRLVAAAVILALCAPAKPAAASDSRADFLWAPVDQWRPLLAMNQIVLDKDLRPICYCGLAITKDDLPPDLVHALVAIEDHRFYIHHGIDPLAMLRAIEIRFSGGGLQGGSTLTQQLAKFTLLSDERAPLRKGLDMLWGIKIDAGLGKDDILLAYLNRVNFGWWQGRPIVGVEQASRFFFAKHASDLNLYESAALAGLVNAPLRLNPKRDPKRIIARVRRVLTKMIEQGYVTRAQSVAALKLGVRRGNATPLWVEPRYFASWAIAEFGRVSPAITLRPGMRLFVSLDVASQANAERALSRTLARLAARNVGEAALVALDLAGNVRAMVGGRSFGESQFNRAAQALRQPASAFKPFVYLAAIESGLRPDTKIRDAEPESGAFAGKLGGPFRGVITLERALAVSANGATVRLAQKVGLDKIAAAARRAGITSKLRADESLALGTSEVTLTELTSSYIAFANRGLRARPRGVLAAVDAGGLVYLADSGAGEPAIKPAAAAQMRRMLRAVVAQGTGWPANISDDAAGKTGTSQNNRDAFFIGFSGSTVAGIWLGNDDHAPMTGVEGRDAAVTWANFMAGEPSKASKEDLVAMIFGQQ